MVTFSIATWWCFIIVILLQSIKIDAFAINKSIQIQSAHDLHNYISRDRFAAVSSCNTNRHNINKPYIIHGTSKVPSGSISGRWSDKSMKMATISDDVSSSDEQLISNRNPRLSNIYTLFGILSSLACIILVGSFVYIPIIIRFRI